MTDRQLIDLMRAVDELEHVGAKIFDRFEPLWDDDDLMFRRALATLKHLVQEYNRS